VARCRPFGGDGCVGRPPGPLGEGAEIAVGDAGGLAPDGADGQGKSSIAEALGPRFGVEHGPGHESGSDPLA